VEKTSDLSQRVAEGVRIVVEKRNVKGQSSNEIQISKIQMTGVCLTFGIEHSLTIGIWASNFTTEDQDERGKNKG